MDKEFLQDMIQQNQNDSVVTDVRAIKPITSESVDASNPVTVKKVAYVKTTFRESPNKTVTKLMGYVVVPNSTEKLIIGKPSLDALGFVSDRHSIELRHEDLRFPTVLPQELPKGNDAFLSLCDHERLTAGPGGETRVHSVKLGIKRQHAKGDSWWLEATDVLPTGVELVEGPLVQSADEPSRCVVHLLGSETGLSMIERC